MEEELQLIEASHMAHLIRFSMKRAMVHVNTSTLMSRQGSTLFIRSLSSHGTTIPQAPTATAEANDTSMVQKTMTHQLKMDETTPDAAHEHEHHEAEEEEEDDDDDDMVEMITEGPMGKEWNGPTRGGKKREPTRYGDWEQNGRCYDF